MRTFICPHAPCFLAVAHACAEKAPLPQVKKKAIEGLLAPYVEKLKQVALELIKKAKDFVQGKAQSFLDENKQGVMDAIKKVMDESKDKIQEVMNEAKEIMGKPIDATQLGTDLQGLLEKIKPLWVDIQNVLEKTKNAKLDDPQDAEILVQMLGNPTDYEELYQKEHAAFVEAFTAKLLQEHEMMHGDTQQLLDMETMKYRAKVAAEYYFKKEIFPVLKVM